VTLRLAALFATLLTMVGFGWTGAASAANLDSLVTVEITSMKPANPTLDSRLEVTGVLRNASTVSLRDVGVRMQVSTLPLTATDEVLTVASGGSVRVGNVVAQRPGFVTLQPGGESSFTLSVPVAELGLSEPGVYEVRIDSVDGAADLLGSRSTTMTWFPPGSVSDPASVVMLWPLIGTPARDAENVILSPAVAAEFGPAGRLSTLLTAGADHPTAVSWVLDPQTLQSAELLSRSHVVRQPDAVEAEQPADPAAATWLANLRQATSGLADVTAAGYADPDSPAEVAAGLLSDLVLATTTASAQVSGQLERSVQGAFSWPPGGILDQPTLNALRGAGVQHVVLAPATVSEPTGGSPLVKLSTDSGPITAVVGDPDLEYALRSIAERPTDVVVNRQLFLSLVALRAVNEEGATLVAVPPATWDVPAAPLDDLLTALTDAEYATPQPLSAALTALEPSAPGGELVTANVPAQQAQLSADHLAGVAAAGDTLAEIGDIAVQPGDSLRSYREALLRSSSAAWRDDPAMGALVLDRTAAQIAAQRDKVAISGAGTVSFPGEQGRVPVTVSNDLSVAVTVGLTLSATPSYRIQPSPMEPFTIPPGQRLSLEVPVRVIGSAPLVVTAQLLTPQGEPYGSGETFELRTSAYSRVAAWAVALAFGALIVMAAASVVRRVRRREGDDDD
jgi:hypothetical protein